MIAQNYLPRNAFESYAIRWNGRRTALFSSWAISLALASGAFFASTVALTLALDPTPWLGVLAFGLLLAGLGWLITAPVRFSAKPIKPLRDPYYAARKVGGSFASGAIFTGIAVLLVAAAMLFTPHGLSPDVFPIYALALGFGLCFCGYGLYADALIRNCPEEYGAWLARTGRAVPPPPTAFYRLGDPNPIDPEVVYAAATR